MSGRTKRILYRIFDLTLWLAATAIIFVMLLRVPKERPEFSEIIAVLAILLAIILGVPVFLHELGHLFFGWIGGMKLVSFKISLISGKVAGATEMFPKNDKRVRAKFLLFAFGGAILNFIFGGIFLSIYLVFDYHPALLFLGMLSPFIFYEGIRSLIPVELNAGKTDGAIIFGLIKKSSEEEIMLRVLTAQGILYRRSFSDIPKELLYNIPVVRADLPSYHAVLFLRMQYELSQEKIEEARKALVKLRSLEEYFSESQRGEVLRYEAYFNGKFEIKKQLLKGVNDLEKKLENSISVK